MILLSQRARSGFKWAGNAALVLRFQHSFYCFSHSWREDRSATCTRQATTRITTCLLSMKSCQPKAKTKSFSWHVTEKFFPWVFHMCNFPRFALLAGKKRLKYGTTILPLTGDFAAASKAHFVVRMDHTKKSFTSREIPTQRRPGHRVTKQRYIGVTLFLAFKQFPFNSSRVNLSENGRKLGSWDDSRDDSMFLGRSRKWSTMRHTE